MWEKLIYHCSRTSPDNAETRVFGDPVEMWINYQPVSGYTDILRFGENVSKTFRAIVDFGRYKEVFKEGDLVYLCGRDYEDGQAPDTSKDSYVNGDYANAEIKSVRNQFMRIELIFQKP